jgi:hypothetical protein
VADNYTKDQCDRRGVVLSDGANVSGEADEIGGKRNELGGSK